MKIIAVVPARYQSTRLPGKMMADLGGIPLIRRTYENVASMKIFDEVLVATDSDIIFKEITEHHGHAIMTSDHHATGSDRIAEAVAPLNADIIVNVQGDEPFVEKNALENLIRVFQKDEQQEIALASLMQKLTLGKDIINPNTVKVIVDNQQFALYFSRSPIPYPRNTSANMNYYRHIGIYAFRKKALLEFTQQPMLQNEETEMIEAIRYLEYGKKIKMILTDSSWIGIDTQDDLDKARKMLGC